MASPADRIDIDLVLATPLRQTTLRLSVPLGSCVRDVLALAQPELQKTHPDLIWPPEAVGIWGRRVSWEQPVLAGDRIELYRPLRLDPMAQRRLRAAEHPLPKKKATNRKPAKE